MRNPCGAAAGSDVDTAVHQPRVAGHSFSDPQSEAHIHRQAVQRHGAADPSVRPAPHRPHPLRRHHPTWLHPPPKKGPMRRPRWQRACPLRQRLTAERRWFTEIDAAMRERQQPSWRCILQDAGVLSGPKRPDRRSAQRSLIGGSTNSNAATATPPAPRTTPRTDSDAADFAREPVILLRSILDTTLWFRFSSIQAAASFGRHLSQT
jgi:hypothetical protein